jgi:glutamine amidotransferase
MIHLVDFGMGNLNSLVNAFSRFDVDVKIASNPAELQDAKKIVLPGVGHFAQGMENLKSMGFVGPLSEAALEKRVPLLGICLGMQLLTSSSEEGNVSGLGWIPAKTKKFVIDPNAGHGKIKVPHVGFNIAKFVNDSRLEAGNVEKRFYFTHSYCVSCDDPAHVLAETRYGVTFASAINRDNIYGIQFHPEKSHSIGIELLKSFVERC